ncbi:hypothetical protein, partial [Pseudomonas sp. NPDC087626]|uniref:hypothetical protein n=1 Tax=Pseudomonas sp. NPDC087626 TaxID=3364444 RepID=UPI003828484E
MRHESTRRASCEPKAYRAPRKTYAIQQRWRFLRLLEAVQHQNRALQENGLAQVHVNVAIRQKLVGSSGLFAGKPAPTRIAANAIKQTTSNTNEMVTPAAPSDSPLSFHWGLTGDHCHEQSS